MATPFQPAVDGVTDASVQSGLVAIDGSAQPSLDLSPSPSSPELKVVDARGLLASRVDSSLLSKYGRYRMPELDHVAASLDPKRVVHFFARDLNLAETVVDTNYLDELLEMSSNLIQHSKDTKAKIDAKVDPNGDLLAQLQDELGDREAAHEEYERRQLRALYMIGNRRRSDAAKHAEWQAGATALYVEDIVYDAELDDAGILKAIDRTMDNTDRHITPVLAESKHLVTVAIALEEGLLD